MSNFVSVFELARTTVALASAISRMSEITASRKTMPFDLLAVAFPNLLSFRLYNQSKFHATLPASAPLRAVRHSHSKPHKSLPFRFLSLDTTNVSAKKANVKYLSACRESLAYVKRGGTGNPKEQQSQPVITS
jgi:hypothetical protein